MLLWLSSGRGSVWDADRVVPLSASDDAAGRIADATQVKENGCEWASKSLVSECFERWSSMATCIPKDSACNRGNCLISPAQGTLRKWPFHRRFS
jgi:hypothetical protein